jgi:hypothetical protein
MAKAKGKKTTKPSNGKSNKPDPKAKGSGKSEEPSDNAVKELNEALTEVYESAIQPVNDLFIEWEEKYEAKKLNDAAAMALGEKILKAIKDGAKKASDILEG